MDAAGGSSGFVYHDKPAGPDCPCDSVGDYDARREGHDRLNEMRVIGDIYLTQERIGLVATCLVRIGGREYVMRGSENGYVSLLPGGMA